MFYQRVLKRPILSKYSYNTLATCYIFKLNNLKIKFKNQINIKNIKKKKKKRPMWPHFCQLGQPPTLILANGRWLLASQGVAKLPSWPLGVVRPPPRSKMGVVETTPKSLGCGSATPI
jgi:hypothetical protein